MPQIYNVSGRLPHFQAPGAEDQQKDVAAVASKLFGDTVFPENVIGETLRRSTVEMDFGDPIQLKKLTEVNFLVRNQTCHIC